MFGYGITPWDMIRSIAAARGVDDDTETFMWQAGGYLLPAIVATIMTFMIVRYSKFSKPGILLGGCVTLAAAAVLCRLFGLGLAVYLGNFSTFSGPGYVALPFYVASAYINSWGVSLFITGLALGTAAAMHVDNWYQKSSGL